MGQLTNEKISTNESSDAAPPRPDEALLRASCEPLSSVVDFDFRHLLAGIGDMG